MLRIVEARRAAALAIPPAIDVFIAPSEFLRGVFRDAGWGGGRWVTVGHGVDRPETARPAVRSGGSEPLRIGFAGTVTPLKGVDVLIHAVAMLEPGACTVEVRGSTELRPEYAAALKREARSLPIAFHGAHAPGEAQRFVQQWDVCVVPSRWVENQPLVILEAFAAGVPVVASDLGGMRELVHEGRNGRLFESGNAAALAAVLRELAADRGALAALRAGVTPPPSMETHVARIESLYAEARAAHAS